MMIFSPEKEKGNWLIKLINHLLGKKPVVQAKYFDLIKAVCEVEEKHFVSWGYKNLGNINQIHKMLDKVIQNIDPKKAKIRRINVLRRG